jgi:serine/threonine protein kinase
VHRDLKPSNVLLSPVGPRVIDFGIARALDAHTGVTRTGQIIGTPAYLAPELVIGGDVTLASDVFSWGCVVVFAGVGRGPFEGTTIPEILHRVAYEPPRLEGLDPGLRALVERALQKSPDDRPTVPELLEQLTGRRSPQPSAQPNPLQSLPTQTMEQSRLPPPGPPPRGPQPYRYSPPPPPRHVPPRYHSAWTHPSAPYPPRRRGRVVGTLIAAMAAAAVLVIALLAATRSGHNGGSPQSSGRSSPKTTGKSRVDTSFLGTWRGSIDQQGDPKSPYPAVLSMKSGRVNDIVGRSSYPTLHCSGQLTLLTASKDRLTVRENITEGTNCVTATLTLVHRSNGSLDYSFSSPVPGHGTLRKQS